MSDDASHDPLWRLLGKARRPKVSPFFARNVLREIRLEKPSSPVSHVFTNFVPRILQTKRLLLGSTFCILGCALWMSLSLFSKQEFHLRQHPSDLEMIVQLDQYLSSEASERWVDSSTY